VWGITGERNMESGKLETTVRKLMEWKKKRLLLVNDEYQRGAVWTLRQEKLLIDSIMRGYPIPQFYFHFIKTEAEGLRSESYEVIDGQQRINAMYKFFNNGFKLFHPKNDKKTGLPKFLCEQSCPWGGKTFEALSPQLKDKFLDTHLQVAQIQSDNVNEIR